MGDKLKSFINWLKQDKKKMLAFIGVLVVILFLVGTTLSKGKPSKDDDKDKKQKEVSTQQSYNTDEARLNKKCGKAPSGFRWGEGCVTIATGQMGLSDEDVLYTYLRSLSLLDIETAEKYSYKTEVINSYSKMYSAETEYSFTNEFKRSMYTETLQSMVIQGIAKRAPFADKRRVITMNIQLIDTSDKDFWVKDKKKIFDNLNKYKISENDTSKAKEYLFKYVREYYGSDKSVKKTVEVPITVEQTTDGNWLVVNDSSLDAICKFQDGDTIVAYILEQFDLQSY